ncbi:aromatic ring-hydroxylating dioxygenase subunit alpha [Cyanobacterium aponinum FACHB-4101]|uniref:aromatic ring-hydroxylating dioxygenase subunit alpha n=1 Tax=Cyanobacterium aponinum TaxID=379064 RepID=UPI0016804088|nr:aromatic ring-hydroxylating dioxygenase subunit alpha [Cyanobacterium aponinum]MBD2394093.1 aromatic ring-hydroxylating dioxygenase subunit alpha [Cyanobacterium aponinum FACHB-4101]
MGQLEVKPNIRTCGINPNHWYVVARSVEVTDKPYCVTLWHENIVIFRNAQGKIKALEDRCPHRQVRLSDGVVVGDDIECAYHGWQFNGEGKCSFVPYLQENQRLPSCKLKAYPVQELDGFIWLFLGDGDSEKIKPMGLPEWEHLNYIASVTTINCPGHFSYLIENLMDMYHGHLHDNYQAWAEANLKEIETTSQRIDVLYTAQSYYRIDKIWSVSQLFFPALRRLHPEPLRVSYVYPHWSSSLGEDFKIYCLFCPIDETTTKAYLIHFTSLQAFWRLHKLPVWFRRFVKNSLFNAAKGLLDGLVEQDIAMIKQEQEAFNRNPLRRNYELNGAIAPVQKLIINQWQSVNRL